MKLNDIPKLMPVPFGVSGPRTELLQSSPAGDRKASYKDGFPPITMLLKSAGGLPPDGGNMNQILFELASGQRWANAGAGYKFNTTFSDAVGGYPKGAKLLSNDGTKVYVSTKDDNKTDFNTSPGPDWVTLGDYIGLGDYATKTEANSKLAKDQNGADIPNKPKFIENLGLPELLDKKFDKVGGVITASGAAVDIRTKSDSSGYFQISDASGNAIHQIGKTTAGNELILRNVKEGATVSITAAGVRFNGSLLALKSDNVKYKDLTSSRANNVNYVNNNEHMIFIILQSGTGSNQNATATVSGVDFRWALAGSTAGMGTSATIPIPAGTTYSANGFTKWVEVS